MSTDKRPSWESLSYIYNQGMSGQQVTWRCVKPVHGAGGVAQQSMIRQCSRQNGHGHKSLYCKQHAKAHP